MSGQVEQEISKNKVIHKVHNVNTVVLNTLKSNARSSRTGNLKKQGDP